MRPDDINGGIVARPEPETNPIVPAGKALVKASTAWCECPTATTQYR